VDAVLFFIDGDLGKRDERRFLVLLSSGMPTGQRRR